MFRFFFFLAKRGIIDDYGWLNGVTSYCCLVGTLLEFHYLKYYDATFAEYFYDLKRVISSAARYTDGDGGGRHIGDNDTASCGWRREQEQQQQQ
jgi:hypothetical protein